MITGFNNFEKTVTLNITFSSIRHTKILLSLDHYNNIPICEDVDFFRHGMKTVQRISQDWAGFLQGSDREIIS